MGFGELARLTLKNATVLTRHHFYLKRFECPLYEETELEMSFYLKRAKATSQLGQNLMNKLKLQDTVMPLSVKFKFISNFKRL